MDEQTVSPSKAAAQQGIWFIFVGACAAATHFCSLFFLVQFQAIQPAWANVFAFLIAFIISFFGHFKLTFKTQIQQHNFAHSLFKWFASSILGFIINQSLFMLGLEIFGTTYYIVIWLVITVLVTLCTFVLAKFWAFKGQSQ